MNIILYKKEINKNYAFTPHLKINLNLSTASVKAIAVDFFSSSYSQPRTNNITGEELRIMKGKKCIPVCISLSCIKNIKFSREG